MKNKSCQTGMTFIEIMIALLMGSILLGGVLQVFLGSKQTFKMQQALSRLQENGRFALDFLAKDIRMAGFLGCNSSITSIDINLPNRFDRAFKYVLSGDESITKSWISNACGNNGECIRGTDAITFYSANSCGGLLSNNASSKLYLNSDTCRILAKDIVLISNCVNVNIFRPTQVSSIDKIKSIEYISNNKIFPIDSYVPKEAEVFSVNAYTYFIRTGTGISKQPSLWRLNNAKAIIPSDNPVEFIEGIENMQIAYGVDSGSVKTPNYYAPANQVSNWSKVVSVQISLLAVSLDDNLTSQPVPYTFNNILTTPTDRRIRRVFNTTIALRNRLL
jgi:type IV pilus assembly protein PilW